VPYLFYLHVFNVLNFLFNFRPITQGQIMAARRGHFSVTAVTSKTGPVTTAAMFDKNEWRHIVVIRPW
jgi:hypothetical protein